MKSVDQFVKDWTGKLVDTDGIYPNQCMDLMHQYLIDCFDIKDPQVLSAPKARLIYENFNNLVGHDKFDLFANTPTGVPMKGDIFVFGTPMGYNSQDKQYYGHVCIFLEGNVYNFKSFDANFGLSLPHIQDHTYIPGALGWLRYRGTTQMNDTQKVNAITVIMQAHKPLDQEDREIRKVLGI